jgi:hypothetical protein
MRPDEHKSKESRKYQARKKLAGDTSAAEIADARKKAAKARDKGVGMAAIRRRNGELVETEEQMEERKQRQAKFAKRKLDSNASRYEEETEQGRYTRDLVLRYTDRIFLQRPWKETLNWALIAKLLI